MVSVVDERCGDAWIAPVQDDDQLRPEADELARDIIGLGRQNAALPIDPMVERKLSDSGVQERDRLVRGFLKCRARESPRRERRGDCRAP
jgi:hypothetical protein